MSDHMFGVVRGRVSAREVKRRDRICRAHGGYGYTQMDRSHGTAHGGDWLGWYSAPNRGEPFDRSLAREVLAAVDGEVAS